MKYFNLSRQQSFFLTTSVISLKNGAPPIVAPPIVAPPILGPVARLAFLILSMLLIPMFVSAYNSQLTSETPDNQMSVENPKTFDTDDYN